MSGHPDGLRILKKYAPSPSLELRYFPNGFAELVPSIDYGILFLMAFWSGPSVAAFAKLTQAMREMQAEDLELVVIDVDGVPDVYQLPHVKDLYGQAIAAPTGNGEAAFCQEGQIIQAAILGGGRTANQNDSHVREFLQVCQRHRKEVP